jgi:hypothetical protein
MSPEPPNPFDQACRGLLRRGRVELLCWLLKVPAASLRFVRWLDTHLTVPGQPERIGDTIAHVLRVDQNHFPWAIPVEFQVAPDALMFGRVMVNEGLVWMLEKPSEEAGDRFNLQAVVVNLTGVGRSARRMSWLPDAGTFLETIEWNLAALDANAILEQVASGEVPRELLAWVSLMQNGGEPATIQRWLEVAAQESDPRRKADLALVELFADLTDRTDVWKKALEGFNVIESITYNRWVAKAKIEDVLGFLEGRFGPVPAETKEKIEATTSLEELRRLVTLAAKAGSLDEFRKTAGV